MNWRCVAEPALRSDPGEFHQIARTARSTHAAATAAARHYAELGPWDGFDGPSADAIVALVAALGHDMEAAVSTVTVYADAHQTATARLEPLDRESRSLFAGARRSHAQLTDTTRRLGWWRTEAVRRDRAYQLACGGSWASPDEAARARRHLFDALHEVSELEAAQRSCVAELDRHERAWRELRGREEIVHRCLAERIAAIRIPPSSPGTVVLPAIGRAPELVAVLGRLGGDARSLARYVMTDAGADAADEIRCLINRGDDLGISNGELNAVRDRLGELGVDDRAMALALLTGDELERLFHNVHSSGWLSNDWNDRERTEFYDLIAPLPTAFKADLGRRSPYLAALAAAEDAAGGDDAVARALDGLTVGEGFVQLSFDQRGAMLWQASFYPDESSISDLERLARQEWFRDFDLDDTQRSAKLVAFLSQYAVGDEAIIANSLDHFLGDDAEFRFDWEIDPTRPVYGSALGSEFHLNPRYLAAGDLPLDESVPSGIDDSDTLHMATHTLAHEVNHLVNGDRVAASYEYFMSEYRAYYVGFVAEHGHAPTRDDVERRVHYLMTASTGAYRRIASAVDDPVEGPLIADFVDEMLGGAVDHTDLVASLGAGVADGHLLAPVPVSVDGGPNSLDNR